MPSFDVVSKLDRHEVENAVQQAQKEVGQRYDFKDTETTLEQNADGIVFRSTTEDRRSAVNRGNHAAPRHLPQVDRRPT